MLSKTWVSTNSKVMLLYFFFTLLIILVYCKLICEYITSSFLFVSKICLKIQKKKLYTKLNLLVIISCTRNKN